MFLLRYLSSKGINLPPLDKKFLDLVMDDNPEDAKLIKEKLDSGAEVIQAQEEHQEVMAKPPV